MKLFLIFFAFSAAALNERDLVCWASKAANRSQPLVKALIIDNVTIEAVEVNLQSQGAWKHFLDLSQAGKLEFGQPSPEDIVGAEIIDSQSPFNGLIEYDLFMGGDIQFHWVLPSDLGSKSLKKFRFFNKQSSPINSVIISPSVTSQSGRRDHYTPLYCESR